LSGASEIDTSVAGAVTVTVTDAVALAEAALVAVSVQVAAAAGAVYTLADDTDPHPVLGEMLQVTF
jgi:hypothetical protein